MTHFIMVFTHHSLSFHGKYSVYLSLSQGFKVIQPIKEIMHQCCNVYILIISEKKVYHA